MHIVCTHKQNLEQLLSPYGTIISTRILRDQAGASRGVGFARLDCKENCEKAIEILNGTMLTGGTEPLMVKFADSGGSKKKQARWRDISDYVYEATPHIVSQNGLVNPHRGLVQQGVLTSPYIHTATPSYQVPVSPVSTGISSGTWQPTYYMQPTNPIAASSSVEGVHNLGTQMGQLQISTSRGGTATYSGQPQHTTQYHISTAHGTQYAHQTPTGWTIQHTPIVQQDHSTEHHSAGETKAHHIQVITPEHPTQVDDTAHTVHVYYPNSTWTGK